MVNNKKNKISGKNIVIFSDGTGQAGGLRPDQRLSNIYKLYRACRSGPDSAIDPSKQICFYDPGLGSDASDMRLSRFSKFINPIRKLVSSATGSGFSRNVIDCYEAILKYYEPGDRIYLFGFSRGAYTVRAVGGVMSYCGIPIKMPDGSNLPKSGPALRAIAKEAVKNVYEYGAGHERSGYANEREFLAKRFREKYSCQNNDANIKGNIVPYFIGVFDTVASLGMPTWLRYVIAILIACLIILISWLFEGKILGFLNKIGLDDIFLKVLPEVNIGIKFGIFTSILIGFGSYINHLILSSRSIPNCPKKIKIGSSEIVLKSYVLNKWEFKHYDTKLNPDVRYGRHAQALDETRRSFARVKWAKADDVKNAPSDWLKQIWFAGCHSDIGGSYPEEESRLSDIALKWMLKEATSVPSPLLCDQTKLQLYPDYSGMQHTEVIGMKDHLAPYTLIFPKKIRDKITWGEKTRMSATIAVSHPTVKERFRLDFVNDHGIMKPYAPESLRHEPSLKNYYRRADKLKVLSR